MQTRRRWRWNGNTRLDGFVSLASDQPRARLVKAHRKHARLGVERARLHLNRPSRPNHGPPTACPHARRAQEHPTCERSQTQTQAQAPTRPRTQTRTPAISDQRSAGPHGMTIRRHACAAAAAAAAAAVCLRLQRLEVVAGLPVPKIHRPVVAARREYSIAVDLHSQ